MSTLDFLLLIGTVLVTNTIAFAVGRSVGETDELLRRTDEEAPGDR